MNLTLSCFKVRAYVVVGLLQSSDARSALPLVIFNLSLRVVEPIFYFATKGGGLKMLLGYPTGAHPGSLNSQYDQI